MKTINKKLITTSILIITLIVLLTNISYAKPFTEAFRGGLVQINDFFANEQYKAYAKTIDFFFFSLLFISIYMMGVRYAFKEVKKPEKVIAILLGLMTAFLLVLGGFSATILLPYIVWILYLLLFYFYWWLLKGIKSKFWRFVLALLLTLLTIALVQGLFGTLTAPDAEGFFKSLSKSFEGIQFPEMPGVPDWTRDLFGAPSAVSTGPTTLPPTTTPTAEKEPWYKTWHWLWLLIIPAFFAIRRLMGGPREPTPPTPPTTRDQIISKIKEIIDNKRGSKDKLQELAREIDQLIQQGDTKQGFIAKLTETEEQDIANLFLDTSRRLEGLVEGNVKKLIVKIREFFQELINLKVVEEDIYGLIRESTPNTPSAWVRSILAIVADDKKSQVNGFVYLLQVLIAQNVKEADIPQQYRAENVPKHAPIERKGILWLIAYCFNIERKETILAKTLANLFEQSHIQDLVKGRFKQVITNEQQLEAYHQREKVAVALLLIRVAKQIELMEKLIDILGVTPTGPQPKMPPPTVHQRWPSDQGKYNPEPPVDPVFPIQPKIRPQPKPGPTRHKGAYIDLSKYFLPIKNQNGAGACAAFAGSSIVEYMINPVEQRKDFENDLSELFLWYEIRPDKQDNSGPHAMDSVPNSLIAKGVCFEKLWKWLPLDARAVPTKFAVQPNPQEIVYPDAFEKRIISFRELSPTDPDSWVDELLKKNPVLIGMEVDEGFRRAGGERKNFHGTIYNRLGKYHGLVIVGFTSNFPNPQDPKVGIPAFKIRNSWGSNWGENGYIWVAYDILPQLLSDNPIILEEVTKEKEPKKQKLHTLILTPTNSKPDGPIEIVGIYHDAWSKDDLGLKIGKDKEKENRVCEIVLADTVIEEQIQARIYFFKYEDEKTKKPVNRFKIIKEKDSKTVIKVNGSEVKKFAIFSEKIKTLQINEYEFKVELDEKEQEVMDRQRYLIRFDDKILKLKKEFAVTGPNLKVQILKINGLYVRILEDQKTKIINAEGKLVRRIPAEEITQRTIKIPYERQPIQAIGTIQSNVPVFYLWQLFDVSGNDILKQMRKGGMRKYDEGASLTVKTKLKPGLYKLRLVGTYYAGDRNLYADDVAEFEIVGDKRKKMLIGVEHKNEEEIKKVLEIISPYQNPKVGIELPEDYEEKERYGLRIFFFGDLSIHLRMRNIELILLENPDLVDNFYALQLAIAVSSGKYTKESIESELRHIESDSFNYQPPEIQYIWKIDGKRYRRALRFLEQYKTLRELEELLEEVARFREKYMLETIKASNPEIVIVGDGHAKRMKDSLSEYEYIKTFTERIKDEVVPPEIIEVKTRKTRGLPTRYRDDKPRKGGIPYSRAKEKNWYRKSERGREPFETLPPDENMPDYEEWKRKQSEQEKPLDPRLAELKKRLESRAETLPKSGDRSKELQSDISKLLGQEGITDENDRKALLDKLGVKKKGR